MTERDAAWWDAAWWAEYDERCKYHADAQGATAVAEELRAQGIAVTIEQTGGFCMVPTIYGGNDVIIMVTRMDCDADRYEVGVYNVEEDGMVDEPAIWNENATLIETLDLIEEHIGSQVDAYGVPYGGCN